MSSCAYICIAGKVKAERQDKGSSSLDEGSLLLQQHQPLLQLCLTQFTCLQEGVPAGTDVDKATQDIMNWAQGITTYVSVIIIQPSG